MKINISFMRRFRFGIKVEMHKIIAFVKTLALLLFFMILTILLFRVAPQFFNVNFVAYTLVFDILYILTIFPLSGGSLNKFAVLLVGNIFSFIWNCLYPHFLLTLIHGNPVSNMIFQFINPVVNALWIISAWAFGFSLITVQESAEEVNI